MIINMVGGGNGQITSITVDVYSAASDTVYYYADNDTSTPPITICTTDTSGTGRGEIIFPVGKEIWGANIYSTVATASDMTSPYVKAISLTKSTTEIYVMPDSSLYWYGNQCTWLSGGWTEITTQYTTKPLCTVSFNTNNVNLNATSFQSGGIYALNAVSFNAKYLCARYKANNLASENAQTIGGNTTANTNRPLFGLSHLNFTGCSAITEKKADAVLGDDKYIHVINYTNSGCSVNAYLYAIWLGE